MDNQVWVNQSVLPRCNLVAPQHGAISGRPGAVAQSVGRIFSVGAPGDTAPMAPHEGHEPESSKQHAKLLAHSDSIRPLWVYDDEDWEYMRGLPSGALICPRAGCRARFKRPIENRQGTRWLANLPGEGCGHFHPRPPGKGGMLSPQHRWLAGRLVRLCGLLGYEAVAEHFDTNSDVYVPAASFSLEVQRWNTNFDKRTKARQQQGGRVVWFITEDARGTTADRALFLMPAVRLRVESRGDGLRSLKPWDNPRQSRDAVLMVFATAARLDPATNHLATRRMKAPNFLREILRGERLWYPPGTEGAPRKGGFWAKPGDLVSAQEAGRAERALLLRESTVRIRPPQSPPAEPSVVREMPLVAQEMGIPDDPVADSPDRQLAQPAAHIAPPDATPDLVAHTEALEKTPTETPALDATSNSASTRSGWWKSLKQRLIRRWFVGF